MRILSILLPINSVEFYYIFSLILVSCNLIIKINKILIQNEQTGKANNEMRLGIKIQYSKIEIICTVNNK